MIKEKLFKAVEDGKLLELRKLLTEHPGFIDSKNDLGRSLLQEAAYLGRSKLISPLVETLGMDVNSFSVDGKGSKQKAPIHLAAEEGHLDTVKAIAGCKGVELTLRDATGKTPLHLACVKGHTKVAQFLLSNDNVKKEVDAIDKENVTALHMASSTDDESEDSEKVLSTLLDTGAKPNAKDNSGKTSLHRAARRGNKKTSLLLINFNGTDINSVDGSKRTPLHYAAQEGKLDVVKLLCERGALTDLRDQNGHTPLDLAADHPAVFEFLSERDVDVNKVLTTVSEEDADKGLGKRNIHVAAKSGNLINVQRVIAKGADLDARNKHGATALHIAAKDGYDDIITALLEAGADPNIRDEDGKCPLHRAANGGHREAIVALCQNKKTDVNAEDENKYSPLRNLLISYSELAEKKDKDPAALLRLLVEDYKAIITEDDLKYAKTPSTGIPTDVIEFLEKAHNKAAEEMEALLKGGLKALEETESKATPPPIETTAEPKVRRGTKIDKSKLPPPPAKPSGTKPTLESSKKKTDSIKSSKPIGRRSTNVDLSKLPPPSKKPSDRKSTLEPITAKTELDELIEGLESASRGGSEDEKDLNKKPNDSKERGVFGKRKDSSGEDVTEASLDELVEGLRSGTVSRQNSEDEEEQKRGALKGKGTQLKKEEPTESEGDEDKRKKGSAPQGDESHSSGEEPTESDVDKGDEDSAVGDLSEQNSEGGGKSGKKKKVVKYTPVRPQPDIYNNFFERLDKEIKLYGDDSPKKKMLRKARKEFVGIVMQLPEEDNEASIIKQLEEAVVKWKDDKAVKELDLYKVFWVLLSIIPNIATLGLFNLNQGWRNFWYENKAQNCLRKMVEKDLVFSLADPVSEHEEEATEGVKSTG